MDIILKWEATYRPADGIKVALIIIKLNSSLYRNDTKTIKL